MNTDPYTSQPPPIPTTTTVVRIGTAVHTFNGHYQQHLAYTGQALVVPVAVAFIALIVGFILIGFRHKGGL